MGFLLHVLREGDLFVDVGANAGAYTILACAGVGARGYAFEPVAAAYERLVENVRINHVEGRVTCVNKGVGAIEGRMDFTSGRDSVNHVLASGERPADVTSADVCTLDGALKGEAPAMMKIDVEGFEWSVLEGAREALTSPRLHSVLLELNGSGRRYGFDEARIPDLMESVGFGACSYDPMSRSLTAVDPAASATGNVLFVRDAERVRNLVQHAPRIRLRGKTLL
jgi:FkbM family methyltransferase